MQFTPAVNQVAILAISSKLNLGRPVLDLKKIDQESYFEHENIYPEYLEQGNIYLEYFEQGHIYPEYFEQDNIFPEYFCDFLPVYFGNS